MDKHEPLIPKHGGYRILKTFQLSELISDVTVLFCDKFVDKRSRTHDQMVQAGRSGKQNIAEGSVDSATSKKIELKLTGIAKGSLVELGLDFEDFLRQRGLPIWPPDHPALVRFKALRVSTLAEFRAWVADEVKRAKQNPAPPRQPPTPQTARQTDLAQEAKAQPKVVRARPCKSVSVCARPCESVPPQDLPAVLAANGALSLINLCVHLLDRQIKAQANAFEKEGGFTERLYRTRRKYRDRQ